MAQAFFWGGLAAASLLVGYALAWRRLSPLTIGAVMGIGAGALVGAIAFELVPESVLGARGVSLSAVAGALTFFVGDAIVDRRGGVQRKDIAGGTASGSGAAIFIGTLLDNIPESLVMGMSLALGGVVNLSFLCAVFISNLPEGVAGTLNLASAGYDRGRILRLWTALVLVSAACSAAGYAAVGLMTDVEGVHASAFAAGAMLTMLTDAMIPEAVEHGGKAIGLLVTLGFLLTATLSGLS